MRYTLFVLAILFSLTSCNEKLNANLTKTSPDGKTKIAINGKKQVSGDAFHTTMTVKSGDIPEGSIIFEIYAADLNDENVKFDWSDAHHAMISFTQSDNEKRVFSLLATETNVVVEEVKQ